MVAVEQQHVAFTEISQTATRMCAEDVVAVLKQLVLQTLRPAEGQLIAYLDRSSPRAASLGHFPTSDTGHCDGSLVKTSLHGWVNLVMLCVRPGNVGCKVLLIEFRCARSERDCANHLLRCCTQPTQPSADLLAHAAVLLCMPCNAPATIWASN